jgi:hypothetical protein
MRALLVLSLKDNSLCSAGAKVLGEGLKGNQSITELDLSGNHMGKESHATWAKSDMSGVIALADAIGDMRAMLKFTCSGDYSDSKPVTMTTTMTEADFSGKVLGVSGSMMVAALLPKCQ